MIFAGFALKCLLRFGYRQIQGTLRDILRNIDVKLLILGRGGEGVFSKKKEMIRNEIDAKLCIYNMTISKGI